MYVYFKKKIVFKIKDSSGGRKQLTIEQLHDEAQIRSWGFLNEAVEDELFDMVQMKLDEQFIEHKGESSDYFETLIINHHVQLEKALLQKNADVIKKIIHHRCRRDRLFREKYPKAYKRLELERERYFEQIALDNPALAKILAEAIAEEESNDGYGKKL